MRKSTGSQLWQGLTVLIGRLSQILRGVNVRSIAALIMLIALLTGSVLAGVDRIEVSPASVINLSSGHSGAFMGGAVTGDIFFNRFFALRTTIGITKNRYFPEGQSYDEADYGLWLAISPYAELNFGNAFRPYLSVLGSFSTWDGYGSGSPVPAFNLGRAPVNRIQPAATRSNAYSFGATIGGKVPVTGSLSLFGEVTHFFFTSFVQNEGATFGGGDSWQSGGAIIPGALYYNWDKNPTYISLGMSYGFDVSKKK